MPAISVTPAEVLNVILSRVALVAKEIDDTANGLRNIATRIATPLAMSDEQLTAEVRNYEAQLERLIKIRTALDSRLTAFALQRHAAQHPEADDPFADPSPVLKAS